MSVRKSLPGLIGLLLLFGVARHALAEHVYWTTGDGGTKIQRANLDGSNVEDLVTSDLDYPCALAVDGSGGKMYWIDYVYDAGKIQRANLDGSNVQDLVTGLVAPRGIALDVNGGKMYWTDNGQKKIQRANLDGSDVEDLVTAGLEGLRGIALDISGGKMYWVNRADGKIQRANLDGSGDIEDLLTDPDGGNPYDLALDVAGGKVYWTNWSEATIRRANLDDGSDMELLVGPPENPANGPRGIALDVGMGKIYWADANTNEIRRANFDGEDIETLSVVHPAHVESIALDLSSTNPVPAPSSLVGLVSMGLIGVLGYVWRKRRPGNPRLS